MTLDLGTIRQAPKVSLHDHLDGGLRAQTIIDLAAEIDHPLPATDPDKLTDWFLESCTSGSLVRYLEPFEHTVAVMQTAEAIRRVAREFVEDLAADGVVYGEARWAPEQHLRAGLTPELAIEAVRDGMAEGVAAAAKNGRSIVVRQIVTSMRHGTPTLDIAKLAVQYRYDSVGGFDIAGAEDGFPPSRFRESFDYLRRNNAHYTIHAGEAFGLPSIWEAVQLCGTHRLGHGVRIADDITIGADGIPVLGELASYIRDQRIPLELCPSSNLQTGAASSIAEHPIGLLTDLRFRVTVNSDNQLMSQTTLSNEFRLLSEAFGYDLARLRWFTINAAKSAFLPFDQRGHLIENVIKPGYAALGVTYSA